MNRQKVRRPSAYHLCWWSSYGQTTGKHKGASSVMSVYRMKDKSRALPWRAVVPREEQKPLIQQFASRKEALMWENEFRKRERLRNVPEYQQALLAQKLGGITVNDLVESYITDHPSINPRDLIKLRAFQRESICTKGVLDITRQDVNRFIEKKSNDKWNSKIITPRTVRRHLNIIQSVFEHARKFRDGFESLPNHFRGVRITGSSGGRRDRSLEGNKLERILAACKKCYPPNDYYIPLAIWLAIDTGMRRQEILNLRWADIDDVNRRITIRKSKTDKVMGRTNGTTIALPAMAKHLLVTLAMKRAKQRKMGVKLEGLQGEWLEYPSDNERIFPMTAFGFSQAWDRVLKRAGITNLHFHDLRREANVRFINAGLLVEERNLMLRHADSSMNAVYIGRNHLLDIIQDKLDRFVLNGLTYNEAMARHGMRVGVLIGQDEKGKAHSITPSLIFICCCTQQL
jgi:integrase